MLILVQLLFKVQPQWLAGEQRNYVMPPVSLQRLTYGTLSSLTHCFDSLIRKKYKTDCCWLDLHVICSIQMSNYWKSREFFFRVCYWHSPFSGATWQNRTLMLLYTFWSRNPGIVTWTELVFHELLKEKQVVTWCTVLT